MSKPLKQRTIHFPDGTTAKVHPEENGRVVSKPSPWHELKTALVRWLVSLVS